MSDPQSTAAAVEAFLAHLRLRNASPQTIAAYRTQLRRLGHLPTLDALTHDALAAVLAEYLSTHKGSGAQIVHAAIKSFTRWLYERGDIANQPMARVPVPRATKKQPRYLSEQEVERLLATAAAPARAGYPPSAEPVLIVKLLLSTGLRAAELCALEWRDVDFDEGVIRVRHGKGDRARMVPLAGDVAALLRQRPRRGERIFDFTATTLSSRMRRLGERAGVENMHTHLLRHTFASWSLKRGADALVVQTALGHTTLAMTQHYVDAVRSETAVERIRDLDILGSLKPVAGGADEDATIDALLDDPRFMKKLAARLLTRS